jgi:hypothetical protein
MLLEFGPNWMIINRFTLSVGYFKGEGTERVVKGLLGHFPHSHSEVRRGIHWNKSILPVQLCGTR